MHWTAPVIHYTMNLMHKIYMGHNVYSEKGFLDTKNSA